MKNQEYYQIIRDVNLKQQIKDYTRKILALNPYDDSTDQDDVFQMIMLKAIVILDKYKEKHNLLTVDVSTDSFRGYFNRSLKHFMLNLKELNTYTPPSYHQDSILDYSDNQDYNDWSNLQRCADSSIFDGLTEQIEIELIQLLKDNPDKYIKQSSGKLNHSKIATDFNIDRRTVKKTLDSIKENLQH